MNTLRLKYQLVTILIVSLTFIAPVSALTESAPTNVRLTPQAQEAARLLGIESQVQRFIELKNSGKLESLDTEALKLQLSITRKVMTASLELRTTSARLDREITYERQALDKLTRRRDFAVAATTNANFLQLSILSIIIDGPLEETHNARTIRSGNNLNIVSGLMVGGLGAISLLEQHGGFRDSKAPPNMLGQTLGLNAPSNETLPPMLWTYLNSVSPTSPNGLTRREQLIEYWRTAKILPVNIKKQSMIEKVFGPWSASQQVERNHQTPYRADHNAVRPARYS